MKSTTFKSGNITASVCVADAVQFLRSLKKGDVDAVVADPPYGVDLGTKETYGDRGTYDGYEDTQENLRKLVASFMPDALRVAKVVVITPGYNNLWLYPKPDHVGAAYFANGRGYGKWGFNCWQPILYYGSDPHRKGKRPDSVHYGLTASGYSQRMKKIPAEARVHPCPKPLEWMEWLVKRATLPGWTVLDPFMGSGTTLEACARLSRNSIGCDQSPLYAKAVCKRMKRVFAEIDSGAFKPGDGLKFRPKEGFFNRAG